MSDGIPNLVSIIIPAFNAGAFIGRALEGIRYQTHTNWQLIVIEDGSQDATESLVRAFATRVTQNVLYRNNGSNQGVSATRNNGLQLAQNTLIAFLDADDWWEAEHLSVGLQTLENGADFCYSGFILRQASGEKSDVQILEPSAAQLKNPLESLFESNFIHSTSLLILKRAVTEKVGDFDRNLKIGEDCDYWMRAISAGFRIAYTERTTCNYSKHSTSAMAQTLLVAEHKHLFYGKHLGNESLSLGLRKRCYADSTFQYGRLIRASNPKLAKELFLQAWKTQPLHWKYASYWLFCVLQNRDSNR